MRRSESPIARGVLTLTLAAAAFGSACSAGSRTTPPQTRTGLPTPSAALRPATTAYPGAEWRRISPDDAGFDRAGLEKIALDAGRRGANCLVVIRHGRLVADWYWNDADTTTSQEVFSATKSYAGTLVGIAEAEGRLSIDDKVSEYVPEWAGTPSADVTIKDILSNVSGRHWDFDTDYRRLVRAADRTGFAVGLAQDAAPGDVWAYNNSAIQTLDAVLTKATGQSPAAYAQERLFGPLGMSRSRMTLDGAGNTNMFSGLNSTCEDMARFGYLFLREGNWQGKQIVPRRWVEAATGRPSQKLNAAYGYLWWVNARGPVVDPLKPSTRERSSAAPRRRLVEGAPHDMYWALGFGGQVIQVDPGSDTVVVRLGRNVPRDRYGPAEAAEVVTTALVKP
ncbi:serine hydrolase [Microbispora sp. GKU 823]|uniref:serine hydrolase domain-containing protein n=1 Tax=Microbispora sp. GKU 823 TaxID=1652100 RepID=UPI0009A36252|nr:serine hydrolase domain-containing protein [Microbispora sp. GKU 823]OPG05294.1 serine hydrolase [Microbispora sp. GKU 823]